MGWLTSLCSSCRPSKIFSLETLLYSGDRSTPKALISPTSIPAYYRNFSSFKPLHYFPPSPTSEATGVERNHVYMSQSRKLTGRNENHTVREFLLKLRAADKKRELSRLKTRKRVKRQRNAETHPAQPPPSQKLTGRLQPSSPLEGILAPLLARSNLLITREIEWANLVAGFEQENRYAMVDVCYPESPVGFIRERSNVIYRQIFRNRRPFLASIVDANGHELFRVRRPFWWITSSIYAEVDGQVIGVVHRRWHLWRRIYDLYLGKRQFAVVENAGFWHWTFDLKDIEGNVLGQISRDWRGFGYEILTDAGQYVIRFGGSDPKSKTDLSEIVEDLQIFRPLTLSERAVAVALAISLDNDYFSRHGGWAFPFIATGE